MILIKKSPTPPELEKLKKDAEEKGLSDSEGYDLLRNPLKDRVRKSLMKEQGHLCAYCMRRIPDNRILEEDIDLSDVYIEHWKARSAEDITENKGLDYNNLLAVCSGNEKAPGARKRKTRHFTCDKKREDKPLKVNPLDETTIDTIYYSMDGTMMSTDPLICDDVNIRLNLNCDKEAVTLPQYRKEVLDTVMEYLAEQEGDYYDNCEEQLQMWENEEDPKTPYIGIAIWWLKKELAQRNEDGNR